MEVSLILRLDSSYIQAFPGLHILRLPMPRPRLHGPLFSLPCQFILLNGNHTALALPDAVSGSQPL